MMKREMFRDSTSRPVVEVVDQLEFWPRDQVVRIASVLASPHSGIMLRVLARKCFQHLTVREQELVVLLLSGVGHAVVQYGHRRMWN